MAEEQLSTGDVIYLEGVSDDTAALGREQFIHAEGFVDNSVGTAGKGYDAQRGNTFRECLFEVTAQFKYGAQKELEDHSRKFLTAIYESMREIQEQLDLLENLLDTPPETIDTRRLQRFGRLQTKLEKQVRTPRSPWRPRHATAVD